MGLYGSAATSLSTQKNMWKHRQLRKSCGEVVAIRASLSTAYYVKMLWIQWLSYIYCTTFPKAFVQTVLPFSHCHSVMFCPLLPVYMSHQAWITKVHPCTRCMPNHTGSACGLTLPDPLSKPSFMFIRRASRLTRYK